MGKKSKKPSVGSEAAALPQSLPEGTASADGHSAIEQQEQKITFSGTTTTSTSSSPSPSPSEDEKEEIGTHTEEDLMEIIKTEATRIPVTILSGFLGSGKTTLLKYILESPDHGKRIAVIVNDMAELNIDAALVQQTKASKDGKEDATTNDAEATGAIVQTQRELVSLSNGCICCTLRGDLIREIANFVKSTKFDYVVIESTGIAEPQAVAQAFCFDPATEQLAQSKEEMLWTQARLDTCVTMVDAQGFPSHLSSLNHFADKFEDGWDTSTPEGIKEGEKSIVNLLFEQVEFANVILFNKTDLVSIEDSESTLKLIRKLNPAAKIIPTQFAKVDLKEILNTWLFDMKAASESPGWLEALKDPNSHSEVDEYGVGSYVYRSRTPFHPVRIAKWADSIYHFANEWKDLPRDQKFQESDEKHKHMVQSYGNILRAKGFCWLAGRDSWMIGLAQTGRIGGMGAIMPWYTLIPKEQWGLNDPKDLAVIESKFAEPHGDRRQEIVFIGTDLKINAIREAMDSCLLTKKELKRYKFYCDDLKMF